MTASGTSPNTTRRRPDGAAGAGPDPSALARLLDTYAPLGPAPLCPEIRVFRGRSLLTVWNAAEELAGGPVASPFWAYPWPAGAALARVVLDHPEWVRGRRVLDVGTGGGIAALAAARAGAAEVTANDVDPWALATAALAAARQGLAVTPLPGDLTREPELPAEWDVVLCADLAYERGAAPRQRAFLERMREGGARVWVADAERAYFDARGLRPLARYTVEVPPDVEGVERRTARVYALA